MKTLIFANVKGGEGKTSLCVATAWVLSECGAAVSVLDADRQQAAVGWYETMKRAGHTPKVSVTTLTSLSRLSRLSTQRVDWRLVDTAAGQLEKAVQAAAETGGTIVVPCSPGIGMWALDFCKGRELVVPNCWDNTKVAREALPELQKAFGPNLAPVMPRRAGMGRMLMLGERPTGDLKRKLFDLREWIEGRV